MTIPNQIYDNHGRPISYLRLAVTDRCNLRCFYCMPEEGIHYLPKKELLSYEEMVRLVKILVNMGIDKIRITGGEPFVRRDLIKFLWMLREIKGLEKIALTTNGVLTGAFLPELKKIGIDSINLSLDTLDKNRFREITRRDEFDKVISTFHQIMEYGFPLKINMVVMDGKNTDDIIHMLELGREHPVSVRFIEEMPFNGEGNRSGSLTWDHARILDKIKIRYPEVIKLKDPENSTSSNYKIPGFKGEFGIIAAFSRTFCGSCNRIRITAQGTLKTCLYDDGVLDLKKILRSKLSDREISEKLLTVFRKRPRDGFEAERNRKNQKPVSESMSTIGG